MLLRVPALPSAVRRSLAFSRMMVWGYLGCAGVGVVNLAIDRTWPVWWGIAACLLIGGGEWLLYRRLAAYASRSRALALAAHQLWVLALWTLTLVLLWRIDLTPYLGQIPDYLQAWLEGRLSVYGMTVLDYLQLSWRATLLLVTLVFTLKLGFLAWWHRRAAYCLPPGE